MKKKFQQKGITLIALVITIIVLLILAGVSIATLTGDNGILTQAQNAKTTKDKAEIIEKAKLDLIAQSTENKGENISKEQLRIVLKKYFNEEEVENIEIPDDVSTSTDELTSKDGNYRIKLSDIYNGKAESKWVYDHATQTIKKDKITLNIGDYVNDTGTQTVSGFDGKWRVLGVEDGQLLLVTATYCAPFETNESEGISRAEIVGSSGLYGLKLGGTSGWNDGVNKLNSIGAKYNNSKLEKGRSINVEDINKITGYDPNDVRLNPSDLSIRGAYNKGLINQYGNNVTYTIKNGKVWYKGNKAITTEKESSNSIFRKPGESSKITEPYTIQSTYYMYFPETLGRFPGAAVTNGQTLEGISTSGPAYDMLFKVQTNKFWLASYCVNTNEGYAQCGLFYVPGPVVDSYYYLWDSGYGDLSETTFGVRPVVSLKSSITPTFVSTDSSTGISTYEI